jgi:rubrerythrin
MDSHLGESLIAQVRASGYAYLRNLLAAEAAILRGQFNVAKILRASAHAHRVLGMEAARLGDKEFSPTDLFATNLAELASALDQVPEELGELDADAKTKLKQSALVRARVRDLMLRSIKSLETHPDVMESDVAQFLWGCYSCGYIAEGDRPDVCVVCGALGAEFQLFGPFYSVTPEHLGQLTPSEIMTTVEAVPGQLAEIIAGADDESLSRKPSKEEWCVKEIMGHMLETDSLFAQRVRVILAGQGVPDITTPIPPWKLQEGKGYERMAIEELLERFRQNRSESLTMVRGLRPEQWARQGSNGGTGTSVLDLGTWLAHHDQGHTAQIGRLYNK